jgi:hypothetical protein
MTKAATVLDQYVTVGRLCAMFKRSALTIAVWRETKGLPYVEIPGDDRPAIRFDLPDVLKWAKKNKIRVFDVDEEA